MENLKQILLGRKDKIASFVCDSDGATITITSAKCGRLGAAGVLSGYLVADEWNGVVGSVSKVVCRGFDFDPVHARWFERNGMVLVLLE
jgi:hypothetical protein